MSAYKHSSGPIQRQEGWVLIIGLVILAMLSTLGISLMRSTQLEEKMSGASREINLSFQAAESALRDAEAFIEAQTAITVFDTTGNGIYSANDDEQDVFDPASWIDAHSKSYGSHGSNADLAGVGRQPRYMIKKIEVTTSSNKVNDCVAVDDPDACPDTEATSVIFRITARGTGGSGYKDGDTPSSQRLLRTHYGKSF